MPTPPISTISRHGILAALGLALTAGGLFALDAPASALPSGCGQAGTVVTCTFATAGTVDFAVPAAVTSAQFALRGGSGGDGLTHGDPEEPGGVGGAGGTANATLALTPGIHLDLIIGGAGGNGTVCDDDAGTAGAGFGGAGGGGPGGGGGCGGGGGGGGSFVMADGASPAAVDPRLAAGGGGGGGGAGSDGTGRDGGDGGGLAGDPGSDDHAGAGGTQTTNPGPRLTGGSGDIGGDNGSVDDGSGGGGGGGGGYVGGGGGQTELNNIGGGGGGGGSGFLGAGVTGGSFGVAAAAGDGRIAITYTAPASSNTDTEHCAAADDTCAVNPPAGKETKFQITASGGNENADLFGVLNGGVPPTCKSVGGALSPDWVQFGFKDPTDGKTWSKRIRVIGTHPASKEAVHRELAQTQICFAAPYTFVVKRNTTLQRISGRWEGLLAHCKSRIVAEAKRNQPDLARPCVLNRSLVEKGDGFVLRVNYFVPNGELDPQGRSVRKKKKK